MPINIEQVASTDLINTGRTKWNNNDETLKNAINSLEAQQAAHAVSGHPELYYTSYEINTLLNNHKSSADHDSRYDVAGAAEAVQQSLEAHKTSGDHDSRYIPASTLSSIVRTTLDQVIDGAKTFLKGMVIKFAGTALQFKRDDGEVVGEVYITNDNEIGLKTRTMGGSLVPCVWVDDTSTSINFERHDVYSKGKRLATIDEVLQSANARKIYYIEKEVDYRSAYTDTYLIRDLWLEISTTVERVCLWLSTSDLFPIEINLTVNEAFPTSTNLRTHLRIVLDVNAQGNASLVIQQGINVGSSIQWSNISTTAIGTLQPDIYQIGVKVVTL